MNEDIMNMNIISEGLLFVFFELDFQVRYLKATLTES